MRIYRFLTVLLFATVAPCFATGLSYTLAPSDVQALAGATVLLGGTLQNNGTPDLFLNDFSIQPDPPADAYLAADPNYFFENVPGVLSTGQPYVGSIFELFVASNAPIGTFTGSGTIYGGVDAFANDPLGTATFTIDVIAPEPAPAGLFVTGVAAMWVRRRVRAGDDQPI